MEVRIASIADIHFGANNLYSDILYTELEDEFIAKMKIFKPTMIVINGDLYDKRTTTNSPEVMYCNKFIYELKTSFPTTYIIIIHGTLSHDYMQLDSLSQYCDEYFKLYKTVTIDYITGMKILFIPEEYYSDKKEYDKYLNVDKNNKYDFVFIHGLFSHVGTYALTEGAKRNKICFNYKDFENNVYGKVNCGHIHIHSEYKNIDYDGSFSRWKHGEEEPKGFMEYVYDTTKHKISKSTFIVNEKAPIWKTMYYEQLPNDNKKLIELFDNESKKCISFRILMQKIVKETDTKFNEVISLIKQYKNIILDKVKQKIIIANPIDEEQKKLHDEKVEQYSNKTFDEVTIEYAKNEFNEIITKEDIAEVFE
jgi:hypothetical protein